MSANHWGEPLKWNAQARNQGIRYRVFCASMADVFEERAPESEQTRLWNLIVETPHLDWQILTKRPERIVECLPTDWGHGYSNVWLGTSVEDERVIKRIECLKQIPAVVRFISLEPLIGPIPNLSLQGIHWAIVGGESGNGARPMRKEWVLDIQEQCRIQNVPFFFKQWGGIHKKKAGRELEGEFYNAMPILRTSQLHL